MQILLLIAALIGQPSSPLFGAAWDDLRFPATMLRVGASNPPSWVAWRDDGSGSPGVLSLSFADQTVAGNEEQVWLIAQMPHAWREGTAVYPHIHWNLEDATSCNARFCTEYALSDTGEAWSTNTSTQCADCASGATATVQQICDIFSSGLSMTGYEISALVSMRLYRNSSHANDTCNGKAAVVHTSDFHFQIDRPGSRQKLTK